MATRGKKPRRPRKPGARANRLVSLSAGGPLSRREREFVMLPTKSSRESSAQVELCQPTLASTALRLGALRAVKAAERVFAFVELLVPKRVASEESGDALEIIRGLGRADRPVWHSYLKIVTTLIWIFAHAAREVVKGPATQKAATIKRG